MKYFKQKIARKSVLLFNKKVLNNFKPLVIINVQLLSWTMRYLTRV